MPQRQRHRGRHPQDEKLFGDKWVPILKGAVTDLSFLLSRGYKDEPALKLVGDHYQLASRQRLAVQRAACSDQSMEYRGARCVPPEALHGARLAIDGYNLLITAESALSDGILIKGRDGCIRDMSSIHSSYHKVEETLPAIRLLGETLAALGLDRVCWYFDAPVSNSGRLKRLLAHEAERNGWNWQIELVSGLDALLADSEEVVITTDGWILDRTDRWANLVTLLVAQPQIQCEVLDLASNIA